MIQPEMHGDSRGIFEVDFTHTALESFTFLVVLIGEF